MSYHPNNPNSQATSANSAPVVVASDQSAINVNTELPTAAALGDAGSPTQAVPHVGAAMLGYSSGGGTLQRIQTAGNGTDSNGTGILGSVTMAQFDDVSPNTVTENQFGNLRMSTNRNLYGTIRDAAGNERGANVNAQNQLSVSVDNTAAVSIVPTTTGGWSVNSQTALSNTKIAVKAAAGTFGGYMVYNPNPAATFIQVFDVASGSVTLGSTTPAYVITVPPASGANVEFSLGISHATAITLAATTTATGSSAPASALTGFFLFK